MQGFTVWFTGLPSAGKSTLAGMLAQDLEGRGCRVEVLDGDEIRQRLSQGLGYGKEDRDENVRRLAFVAKLLSRNGVVAVIAAISPYRASRAEARKEIGRFVEVYVQCPLEVCRARDPKGLYQRALTSDMKNFTGISDPYEPPSNPEVVVKTALESPDTGVRHVLACLEEMGFLSKSRNEEQLGVPI